MGVGTGVGEAEQGRQSLLPLPFSPPLRARPRAGAETLPQVQLLSLPPLLKLESALSHAGFVFLKI